MKTELNNRVLFYDGMSAWKGNDQALLDLIFTFGPDKVFSYEPIKGIEQKTESKPLPDKMWNIPQEYQERDLETEFRAQASSISPEAVARVDMELALYEELGMMPILKALLYIRDKMIENNVVWGVGRGSSVSSYILYLMDIHSIDSLKYKLDVREFLR